MKILGYSGQDVIVLVTRDEIKSLKTMSTLANANATPKAQKLIETLADELEEGDWNR